MNTEQFNNNILKIIKLYSHQFYRIHPDSNIICRCVDKTSKNPNPDCPICLGTGRKIYIKKIEGAYQDTDLSAQTFVGRMSDRLGNGRKYYIPCEFEIHNKDMFIDNGDIFFVVNIKTEHSFRNQKLFYSCISYMKKFNKYPVLKNFNNIIREST